MDKTLAMVITLTRTEGGRIKRAFLTGARPMPCRLEVGKKKGSEGTDPKRNLTKRIKESPSYQIHEGESREN